MTTKTIPELNRSIETIALEIKARHADAESCRASGHVGLAADSDKEAARLAAVKRGLVAELKAAS